MDVVQKTAIMSTETCRRTTSYPDIADQSSTMMDNTGNDSSLDAIITNGPNVATSSLRTSTPDMNSVGNKERLMKAVIRVNSDDIDGLLHVDGSPPLPDVPASPMSVSSIHSNVDLHEHVEVPILGYEILEDRSRFTVFKIHVRKSEGNTWFIFRRYSDFDRLNNKLKEVFPHFRFSLPPKKWFGDNFDRNFLEDRILGLQAFLNNIVGHNDVCNSEPVKSFFCFDEPPSPHDSLEESRALCEILEEQIFSLQQEAQEKESRMKLLKEELHLCNTETESLRRSLTIEHAMNRVRRPLPLRSHQHVYASLPHLHKDQAVNRMSHTSTSSKTSILTLPEEVLTSGTGSFYGSMTQLDTIKLHNLAHSPLHELSSEHADSPENNIPVGSVKELPSGSLSRSHECLNRIHDDIMNQNLGRHSGTLQPGSTYDHRNQNFGKQSATFQASSTQLDNINAGYL